MELKDAFNDRGTGVQKLNDNVLNLSYGSNAGSTYISYDFLTRTMVTRNGHGDAGVVVIPFSQLDREVLAAMREKLIELKGNPPALPLESPAKPGNARPLRP